VALVMKLVPRGSVSQNLFRGLIEISAQSSQAVSLDEALEIATAAVRLDDPGFEPEFDPALREMQWLPD
jgi:hypothetical protein